MTTTLVKPRAAKGVPPRPRKTPGGEARRRASELLKMGSDPTRLHVLQILSGEELHVGAICEKIRNSQPATSHHLALLRVGGLVTARRDGKNSYYSLTETGRAVVAAASALMG